MLSQGGRLWYLAPTVLEELPVLIVRQFVERNIGYLLTTINTRSVMMYTRASASDYDDWANVHQNAGWSSADLLPLLKKVNAHLGLDILLLTDTRGRDLSNQRRRTHSRLLWASQGVIWRCLYQSRQRFPRGSSPVRQEAEYHR